MILGPCQETPYTAITLNTLTYPELRRQTWMLYKKAASMTIGISMDQEICLIHGQVSLSLLCQVRNLQMDFCGPGESDKTASLHPGQTIYGQNSGEECQRTLR